MTILGISSRALNSNQVEYILAGGYAVIRHGYRRVTGDMIFE